MAYVLKGIFLSIQNWQKYWVWMGTCDLYSYLENMHENIRIHRVARRTTSNWRSTCHLFGTGLDENTAQLCIVNATNLGNHI